jgi:hypothetical protein
MHYYTFKMTVFHIQLVRRNHPIFDPTNLDEPYLLRSKLHFTHASSDQYYFWTQFHHTLSMNKLSPNIMLVHTRYEPNLNQNHLLDAESAYMCAPRRSMKTMTDRSTLPQNTLGATSIFELDVSVESQSELCHIVYTCLSREISYKCLPYRCLRHHQLLFYASMKNSLCVASAQYWNTRQSNKSTRTYCRCINIEAT